MNRTLRTAGVLICAGLSIVCLSGFRLAANPGDCITSDAQFQSAGGGCQDIATGRVWSYQPQGNWTFTGARDYCSNLVEGGQSDWRMAAISELEAVAANGGYTHLALTQSLGDWPGHVWSSTSAKARTDYYAIRFFDADVAIRGTKPGSKNGYWALGNICVR